MANTISIDVVKVAAILGAYLNWKILFGITIPLSFAPAASILGYLPEFPLSATYPILLVSAVLGIVGFYFDVLFWDFYEKHTCPNCLEDGKECTVRVRWWRILDSEKRVKEYWCKNEDYQKQRYTA